MALTRWATRALVAAAILWSVAYPFLPERPSHHLSALEGRLLLFGGVSSVAVASALGLWAARRVTARFANRIFEDFGLPRGWARFLREHHMLFGWAAFTTAFAHSLYFASVSFGGSAHAITGWMALGAMTTLVAVGASLNRSSPSKVEANRARASRRLHAVLAAVFIAALSSHVAILAVVFALWVVLAIPTALAWRSRKARLNMEGSEASRGGPEDEPTEEEACPAERERR